MVRFLDVDCKLNYINDTHNFYLHYHQEVHRQALLVPAIVVVTITRSPRPRSPRNLVVLQVLHQLCPVLTTVTRSPSPRSRKIVQDVVPPLPDPCPEVNKLDVGGKLSPKVKKQELPFKKGYSKHLCFLLWMNKNSKLLLMLLRKLREWLEMPL